MFLPALLLILASLAGTIVAYGTHPGWARYSHGLDVILFSRQHQWAIATVALLLCLAVVALVASGKRRAWWLIGLGPIVALFAHRFATDPLRTFEVLESPAFVSVNDAKYVADDDLVVGVTFNGTSYAFPCAALYPRPVVFMADREKRLVLMWSAFANRAVASAITRELRARDVEIVSMPANALLLYNTKRGEFINGLTGLTTRRDKPTGFAGAVPVEKGTWGRWKASHPNSQVLKLDAPPADPAAFKGPLRPIFPQPPAGDGRAVEMRVAVLPTTRPVAIPMEQITRRPVNVVAGVTPVLVFRDPQNGRVRVFERRLDDLSPRFRLNTNPARKGAYLVDLDSNSGWTAEGKAVDGPMAAGKRQLPAVAVDEDLYWGVMKHWIKELALLEVEGIADPVVKPATQPAPARTRAPTGRRTRRTR